MADQVVIVVDPIARHHPVESLDVAEISSKSHAVIPDECVGPSAANDRYEDFKHEDSETPLLQMAECRICQDEDNLNNLETPCSCSGSLKYAHRKCVQHWCNEKGDTLCEICHQPYQPGYTAVALPHHPEATAIDIGGGWTITGTSMDLHDPRLLAMADAERHYHETEYDDYASTNASGAAFCRSVALILMSLLLLRHTLNVTGGQGKDDDGDEPSTFLTLFLFRAAGFLLPCYIMAWAITILQRRRQRQEAAEMASAQLAFFLQPSQMRAPQLTVITAGPPTGPPAGPPALPPAQDRV